MQGNFRKFIFKTLNYADLISGEFHTFIIIILILVV